MLVSLAGTEYVVVIAVCEILVLVSSSQMVTEDPLENELNNTTSFVNDLMEELGPEDGRGPSYNVVDESKLPFHNSSRAEEALHKIEIAMQTVFIVIFALFSCFGAGMIYSQYNIVREVGRLRRVVEVRIPPNDPENPRPARDLEPQAEPRSPSDNPTFSPTTETEEQEERQDDRPLLSGPSVPGGSNPRGDRPDGSTGKTLVSEVMQTIEQKMHGESEHREQDRSGHAASETCEVDKGKLERVAEPPRAAAKKPAGETPGASGTERHMESEFSKKLTAGDTSKKRISNGAPSPQKKSATPSPTKQKMEVPVPLSFDVQG